MEEKTRDIILKSPTGSGKTIILTHFMDEYIKGHSKTVFVWFLSLQLNVISTGVVNKLTFEISLSFVSIKPSFSFENS